MKTIKTIMPILKNIITKRTGFIPRWTGFTHTVSKKKCINLEYQEKLVLGIFSFKFKGGAIWPSPGSFRVKVVQINTLCPETDVVCLNNFFNKNILKQNMIHLLGVSIALLALLQNNAYY